MRTNSKDFADKQSQYFVDVIYGIPPPELFTSYFDSLTDQL